jgi:hypothetical protein
MGVLQSELPEWFCHHIMECCLLNNTCCWVWTFLRTMPPASYGQRICAPNRRKRKPVGRSTSTEAQKWYNEWFLSLSNPRTSKHKTATQNIQCKCGKVRLLKKTMFFIRTIVIQRTRFIRHLFAAASCLTSVNFLRKACGTLRDCLQGFGATTGNITSTTLWSRNVTEEF